MYDEEDLCVNALTGLYLISTKINDERRTHNEDCVNALTGLYLISTRMLTDSNLSYRFVVSMPSRAYTSFLHGRIVQIL